MGAMRQNVTVDVAPVFGNGSICEIEPGDGPSHAFVRGGLIRLHGNPSFQVAFKLPGGNPPTYQFDPANPIWSSQGACPNVVCSDGQITNPVVDAAGTTLTVDVDPTPGTNAVHVSLGFSNGVRCDPIIINN